MRKIQSMLLTMGLIAGSTAIVGCEKTKDTMTSAKSATSGVVGKMGDEAKKAGDEMKKAGDEMKKAGEDAKASAADMAAKAEATAKESLLKPINEMLVAAEEKIKSLTTDESKAAGDAKKVFADKIAKAKELLPKVKDAIKAVTESTGDKMTAAKEQLMKLVGELKTTLGL